ncbi:MAG: ECF-type sigma factor [Panacagrimonas sp.]
MGKVTAVIEGASADSGPPLAELWGAAYEDLKQLARSRLRRRGPMTMLDTTALVNESYLRLAARGQSHVHVGSRGQFLAYASRVMRSIIVDLARERAAEMHGGGIDKLTINSRIVIGPSGEADPVKVHDALLSLETLDPRLAEVVQMRYFGGLTDAEVSEALGLSERTVRRNWEKARAILRTMLE